MVAARGDELERFGVAQRLGKLLTTRLSVLQFQTRLDMLVPFAYEEFGSIVERSVRLAQISAESYTAAGMSSVARIDCGSFELELLATLTSEKSLSMNEVASAAKAITTIRHWALAALPPARIQAASDREAPARPPAA
jgi:hypothetical protein